MNGVDDATQIVDLTEIGNIQNDELRKFVQYKIGKDIFTKSELDTIKDIILDGKNIVGKKNDVYFDDILNFKNLDEIIIKNVELSAKELSLLNNIPSILFEKCNIKDIKTLTHVRQLALISCAVDEIEDIQYLEQLEKLDITNIQTENFDFISRLNNLKGLTVKNIPNFTLGVIDKNAIIENLSIEKIKELDFEMIRNFKNLKMLSVDRYEADNYQNELDQIKESGIKIMLNNIYEY